MRYAHISESNLHSNGSTNSCAEEQAMIFIMCVHAPPWKSPTFAVSIIIQSVLFAPFPLSPYFLSSNSLERISRYLKFIWIHGMMGYMIPFAGMNSAKDSSVKLCKNSNMQIDDILRTEKFSFLSQYPTLTLQSYEIFYAFHLVFFPPPMLLRYSLVFILKSSCHWIELRLRVFVLF